MQLQYYCGREMDGDGTQDRDSNHLCSEGNVCPSLHHHFRDSLAIVYRVVIAVVKSGVTRICL